MTTIKQIRAFYTKDFIRVYQAYNNLIADTAVKNNNFKSSPFRMERTTWIKPSFLWMMYRSGWATKENQDRILAIDITHEGFLWALENSCLSHFDSDIYESQDVWISCKEKSPVVIQWDPERDILLNKLDSKSIQIGLTPPAVYKYINNWIINIKDITPYCKNIKQLISQNKIIEAKEMLPIEIIYPLPHKDIIL